MAGAQRHLTPPAPTYVEEEKFLKSWKPPKKDSDFASQVLAVTDDLKSCMTKKQVQFIFDFQKRQFGKKISSAKLIEVCENYLTYQPDFLKSLSDEFETDAIVEEPRGRDCLDGKGFRSAISKVGSRLEKTLNKVRKPSSSLPSEKTLTNGGTADIRISETTENETWENDTWERETWENPEDHLVMLRLEQEFLILQSELEMLETDRKCIECKDKAREISFLPCGHFIMCKNCAEPFYKCPNCERDVLATATTFLC